MEMDRESVDKCIILLAEVGSSALGVTVAETDDLDLAGICVEPADFVVGLHPYDPLDRSSCFEQLVDRRKADGSPQDPGDRSGPGDTDYVVYSLKKWIWLALTGNPSVLMPLFSPTIHAITGPGEVLRANAAKFCSRDSGYAFLNYMRSQRAQLTGERPKKHTNRPELVEQYGYDTKFAYHAVRLGLQGIEFMQTGQLTLPMDARQRFSLLEIRRGARQLEDVLEWINEIERDLRAAIAEVPNQHADVAWANEFLKATYADAWGW